MLEHFASNNSKIHLNVLIAVEAIASVNITVIIYNASQNIILILKHLCRILLETKLCIFFIFFFLSYVKNNYKAALFPAEKIPVAVCMHAYARVSSSNT